MSSTNGTDLLCRRPFLVRTIYYTLSRETIYGYLARCVRNVADPFLVRAIFYTMGVITIYGYLAQCVKNWYRPILYLLFPYSYSVSSPSTVLKCHPCLLFQGPPPTYPPTPTLPTVRGPRFECAQAMRIPDPRNLHDAPSALLVHWVAGLDQREASRGVENGKTDNASAGHSSLCHCTAKQWLVWSGWDRPLT